MDVSATKNINDEEYGRTADSIAISENIPLVLSVQDLADVLKIGRNCAYELVKSGQIRIIRIGKHIRISQAALQEYLESSSAAY